MANWKSRLTLIDPMENCPDIHVRNVIFHAKAWPPNENRATDWDKRGQSHPSQKSGRGSVGPFHMKSRHLLSTLTLRLAKGRSGDGQTTQGHLQVGSITIPCAIGKAGISRFKREGDKATPAGSFRLLYGYYRNDRGPRPLSPVTLTPLRPTTGWCDDPGSALYNRPVILPSKPSHEEMWRQDGLYNLVLVMDYNLDPRRRGKGSAIFLHCARTGLNRWDLKPTLGCVALHQADLRRLLPRLARGAVIKIL
jgi:L,D-peptidoglycan transpeptidase YkuD (ErfK/YbiS/YcfS/YnhG family)